MRSKFPGYFRPSKDDFDKIWKQGIVVPDTNILLHLLRFRRETRDEIIKTLNAFKPRLWLPYQVAFEFSRKWLEVDEENRSSYAKLKENISRQGNTLSALFDSVARYQIINATGEKAKVERFIKDLCKSVDEASKDHPTAEEAEKIVNEVSSLFTGAMGEKPAKTDLEKWISDAAQRYAKKIPPGFKDERKDGLDKYGDYIIWREMIHVAKSRSLPVLFLSDDRKEDWVLVRGKQDRGPLPEVMQEFWEETEQRFYSYPLTAFLDRAKEYTKVSVSKEAIKDVEAQAKRHREQVSLDQLVEERLKQFEIDSVSKARANLGLSDLSRTEYERALTAQRHLSELDRLSLGRASASLTSNQLQLELERLARSAGATQAQNDLMKTALGYPLSELEAAKQALLGYETMPRDMTDYFEHRRKEEFEKALLAKANTPLDILHEKAQQAELEQLRIWQLSKKTKGE